MSDRTIPIYGSTTTRGRTGWPWWQKPPVWPQCMPDGQAWPKISIITPSYNQGQYLEETIRSVLLQGYPNLEYIVIDGGSSDESASIIEFYAPHLSYWVSEKDNGQTHAVNKGIEKSTGEILGWINSDDMYVAGSFLKIVQAFKNNPECGFVHGDRILIDSNSHVSGWSTLPPFHPQRTSFIICSETAFWRRQVMGELRLNESLRFAMDVDFFCRLYQLTKFLKLNAFVGYFRCHLESKSATIFDLGVEETQRQWKIIFGDQKQKLTPKVRSRGWPVHIASLFRHPFLLALPYFYRRFILKQRGV